MALSTRDLYLVLRARDEASRIVRGLSQELLRAGAAARIASARSNAAAIRQQAAQARAAGATAAQLAALRASAQAWDNEANRIQRATAARQRFGSILQQSSQALITSGVTMAAVGAGTLFWLKRTIDTAIEYEKQVKLTLTQTNNLNTSVEELGAIGKRVASSIGVAFEQIQPALFDIFSSTNANVKQAEILLTGFSKAAVAGQVSIQDASRATIAILNAFNIPLEKVNDVLDIQFQLVKFGVGTYAEFSKHLGNVIPSAARAGQTFQMVAAMLAFMTRNGLSVAMSATSAARALEAMSHPKTIERLEKMGIKVKDAAGNMMPLTDILRSLRDQLDKLPPTDRVAALVNLLKGAGGTIQARRFLEQVLLRPGELEELEGFLGNMNNATGAFGDAYNEMADSVATKTELLSNKWKILKETIGAAIIPEFLKLMDVVGAVFDKFNGLSKSQQQQIGDFLLWGSVVGVVAGAILVLVGGIAGLAAALVVGGEALGMFLAIATGAGVYLGMFGAAMIGLWQNSEAFRNAVMQLVHTFQMLFDKVMEVMSPIAQTIKDTIGDKVMEGLRIAGAVLGGYFKAISDVIQNILIPMLQDLKHWWDENQSTIKPLLNILGQVVKWIIIIGAAIIGLAALLGVGYLIATIWLVINTIKVFVAFIRLIWDGIMAVVHAVGDFIHWLQEAISNLGRFGTQVGQVMQSIPGIIRGAFAAAGSWLINAGREIIGGLIDGIQAALGRLRSTLGAVTSLIPDWKGPKQKDLKLLVPTGKYIMTGLAKGIQEGQRFVRESLGDVTGNIPGGVGVRQPLPTDVAQGGTRSYSNTFYITTQEIDPRKHASDLGWELQGAMP